MIYPLNFVSILKCPCTKSLWLIVIKVTLIICSVFIEPLSIYHLSIFELANVFHSCLFKNVCSLSIFFSIFPLTWIYILIIIYKNSFSMSFSIFPISLISSWPGICLSSNSIFQIISPSSIIFVFFSFFWAKFRICIYSLITVTKTIFKVTVISIPIWICSDSFSCVMSWLFQRFTKIYINKFHLHQNPNFNINQNTLYFEIILPRFIN